MSEKFWKLGIIGWPLGYSLSPLMHAAALKAAGLQGEYKEYKVKPSSQGPASYSCYEKVAKLLDKFRDDPKKQLDGFNVTMPYKALVAAWCGPLQGNQIDRETQLMDSVNAVSIRDGIAIGYNTDGEGFLAPLAQIPHLRELAGANVVLLGAGGAARAIGHALVTKTKIKQLVIWNRHFDKAKHLMNKTSLALEMLDVEGLFQCSVGVVASLEQLPIEESQLVINATSLGMKETGAEVPDAVLDRLRSRQTAYDIVYEPRETKLIREARKRGCRVITGDEMLAGQGAESFRIWTGKDKALDGTPILSVMKKTLDEHFAARA